MAEASYLLSLALGGLLHDIGKFRECAVSPEPAEHGKYTHEPHSHAFVELRQEAFSQPDRVRAIALAHHDPQLPDEKVVCIADRLASAERAAAPAGEEHATGRARRPLVSLIARAHGHRPEAPNLPVGPLDYRRDALFPCAEHPDKDAYSQLWRAFEADSGRIARKDDVETWLHLLQKYAWCIPASAAEKEVPDVSLFDHSRSVAALAVCIGAAHGADEDALNCLLAATKENSANIPVALLVRMDVRGIQSFLYSLTAKGAAKSLRGRSFYIGLVCDALARRVLHALGLPITQALYIGGGHAYLLVPPDMAEQMAAQRAELERAIFLLHGGELSISVGWSVLTDTDLRTGGLSAKWDEAVRACNEDRAHPFAYQEPQWLAAHVFAPVEQGGLAGRCAVCQAELERSASDDSAKCPLCASFEDLGRDLLRARCLALRAVEPAAVPNRARSWKEALRQLGLAAALDGQEGTLFTLDGTDFLPAEPRADLSYGFRPVARVFPQEKDGSLLEFDKLAQKSEGVRRLAALRMDVDNLGKLFQEGMGEGQNTLSRTAALSSQIRWFFEGYLATLCQEWPNKVYGLYSGGDDLFFVGPWNIMPELAWRISQEFSAYCGGNPRLSVSAGISLFPDKYPLYQAADDSEEALEHSKRRKGPDEQDTKNAITFLWRTVAWAQWPDVLAARKMLFQMVTESDKGPRALLQRLRSLQAMNQWDRSNRRVPTQRWRWMAAYLLARMAAYYKQDREKIQSIEKELADQGEAALTRWAQAARWVELETRSPAEARGN
jgi:CRISPR-associated protein Csm1